MRFTGDNEVDIPNAFDIGLFPALKERFTEDEYNWLIGFIVAVINRERHKVIRELQKGELRK